MRVLAVNSGSSSLKFALIEVDPSSPSAERRLASGAIDGVGSDATLRTRTLDGADDEVAVTARDHGEGVRAILHWLAHAIDGAPDAIGHRVVHGGRLTEAVLLDERVLRQIEEASRFAPLHNAPALAAIHAAREAAGPDVPMTASFDTAFHASMPERAARYAIPLDLAERHGIRRYGFHGLAHRYMAERAAALLGRADARLVTAQIGSGVSLAAIAAGRSLDTSMGLTPLEGVPMATRSGDVDPALPAYLAGVEGVAVATVLDWLNTRSGLLGLSGSSSDTRALLDAEQRGDTRAALALELFCYRLRKQVGAYLAALGGADAVVFGGGIGEHQPEIRARICDGLEWCGLQLDEERNADAVGVEARISADGSGIAAFVVAVDEELMIARDAVGLLARR